MVSIEAMKHLNEDKYKLIKKLHPVNQKIVNSFGIPDHLMTAPAANSVEKFNDGYFSNNSSNLGETF